MPSESGVTSSSSMFLGGFRAAAENVGLHGRAERDDFVGIQIGVRRCAGTCSSTSLRTSGMRVEPPTSTTSSICSGCEAGVFHRLAHRADGAVDDGLDQLLVLLARDLALVALAAGKFDIEHR